MTIPGIDYAWQHPDPVALAAAGYRFACRYLSRDDTKNITLTEAQALADAGVWVVANWEYGAQDMLRGYAGGIADAQLALSQALAAGMPHGRPIYFSADWAVTTAQEAAVLAYLSGAASVLGSSLTGEYGGYAAVKAARDSGTVWTWQTFAWSGGAWDPRDTIRQTGSATVGGVQVDTNEAMVSDYGQWQPGRLPVQSPPQEVIMQDSLFAVGDAPDGSNPGIWFRSSDGQYGHVATIGQRDAIVALTGATQKPLDYATHQLLLAMSAKSAVAVDAVALGAAIAANIKLPSTLTLTGTETVTETGKLA